MAKSKVVYDVIPEQCTEIANMTHEDPEHLFDIYMWCAPNAYPVKYKEKSAYKYFCPGRSINHDDDSIENLGPRGKHKILILSPYPTSICGVTKCTPLFDSGKQYLIDTADEVKLDLNNSYITPLVKYELFLSDMKSIPSEWKKEGAAWLYKEVSIVQPEYIIALGSHVLKFFFGSQALLDNYYGKLHDYTFEYSDGNTEAITTKVIVLPAISANEEAREEIYPRVYNQLAILSNAISGIDNTQQIRHIVSSSVEELTKEVDRVIVNNQNIVAIDLEWEGLYPGEPGAHIITFQFSTKPGEAFAVVFDDDNKAEQVKQLKRLLTPHDDWTPRIGGHFLRADMPWVLSLFNDEPITQQQIKECYYPAPTWQEQRDKGGWDTSLMYHAYKEDAKSYGLKTLAECLLCVPKWDLELEDAKDKYLKEHRMKKGDLKGYGCIPIDILAPYGCWDADATRRLAELCMRGYNGIPALLDSDPYGNSCWEPFWRAHAATPGLLEMEMTGLSIDKDRLVNLATTFNDVYQTLLDDFRTRIKWEGFNPSSSRDKQGLLFGRSYTKSVTKAGTKYSMPEEATSLGLTPLYTTGNKVDWDAINAMEDDDWLYMPAADAMTLSILAQENPLVHMLYDICKLGNTLRSNIRPPVTDVNGEITFDAGIYTYLHADDNKVHTHLRQLLKTGRLSSSSPNLQNISKSAEENIQRILGMNKDGVPTGDYLDILLEPKYLYPMRTIITADPDWYFLESDFTGAELAVMAWVSGDPNMIEHVRRNALPESDPNFYDMHSNMAVSAFRLDCPPTKDGLKSIGKKHLRVAAKAVVFGYKRNSRNKSLSKRWKPKSKDMVIPCWHYCC